MLYLSPQQSPFIVLGKGREKQVRLGFGLLLRTLLSEKRNFKEGCGSQGAKGPRNENVGRV